LRVRHQILRVAPDSLRGSEDRHSVAPDIPIPTSGEIFVFRCMSALCLLTIVGVRPTPARRAPLHLIQFTTGPLSFDVGSTVIVGPTEAIVVDCLVLASDATTEADSIAKLGVHLKAIYITHPDEDHYLGAAKFVERFPGTPVYMTPKALDRYKQVGPPAYARAKKALQGPLPPGVHVTLADSLVTVQPLPSTTLTVDGEAVVIHPDEQGDVLESNNSFIWIPSLRAILADDIVFNKYHAYLAASTTEAAHHRWHETLHRIAALHPLVVIASHKKSLDTPDTPDIVDAMDRYLTDFDAVRKTARDTGEFHAAMLRKYPDWSGDQLLRLSGAAVYGLFTPPD
jgi:hypothetical protein